MSLVRLCYSSYMFTTSFAYSLQNHSETLGGSIFHHQIMLKFILNLSDHNPRTGWKACCIRDYLPQTKQVPFVINSLMSAFLALVTFSTPFFTFFVSKIGSSFVLNEWISSYSEKLLFKRTLAYSGINKIKGRLRWWFGEESLLESAVSPLPCSTAS